MPSQIPRILIEDVRAARVVLFLGAGSTAGASDRVGNGPPLGEELRDRLVGRFLDARFASRPLARVAELAISETDLFTVQEFVADQFRHLEPCEAHKELSSYAWRAIATTNYDRVIQKAYEQSGRAVQELIPILSNDDRVDEKIRSQGQIPLIKLHGCETVTQRADLPLVLTIDQYGTHLTNRHLLFNRFEALAHEFPLLFIGHRLEDSDIREILAKINVGGFEKRPRYYIVDPNATDVDTRFWEGRKTSIIPLALDQFLHELGAEIPATVRPLLKLVEHDHPIRAKFSNDRPLSPRVAQLLERDVEFVWPGMPYEGGDSGRFYRGFDLGWYPIRDGLDARRALTDTLMTDVIIRPEGDRATAAELYVVKAEAGAGKSVFLRRVAWEAAEDADVLVLWTRRFGNPDPDALAELQRQVNGRIFLVWDRASDNVGAIANLMRVARRESLPITIITADRSNEWTMNCERLDAYLSDAFELRYMSEAELMQLGNLLEKHGCLGPGLEGRTAEERVVQLKEVAGRQLLVALHEATLGDPFEVILVDEYEKLRPSVAKQVYLTVCVLNRLRTPVRAGLISRVHDVPFDEFKEKLLGPLDHVVEVRGREAHGDYYYQARHPHIAQIVFSRVLRDQDDRMNEYLRIVANINVSYDTDRASFRALLRAKSLHELFPNYQDVRLIFERAEEVSPRDAYLFQQRANYERIRPDGNLGDAETYLESARAIDPQDDTVLHTLAEVYRTRALQTEGYLLRRRIRDEAKAVLRPLLEKEKLGREGSYSRVTLVKLAIDELRDVLDDPETTDREIDEGIRAVERLLETALQRHPDEQYLHTAEADFGRLIADDERSFKALSKAFDANKRDPFVAGRLARALRDRGERQEAIAVLDAALGGNPGDPRLNFQYAEILREAEKPDYTQVAYYYARAFTPGDRNYEAQFWFARSAFEVTEKKWKDRAAETFDSLRAAPMSYATRHDIRDTVRADGKPIVFRGTVSRIEQSYGWITRDGAADRFFVHAGQVDEHMWKSLKTGDRVCFLVGFSFAGPRAIEVELLV